MSDRGRLLCKQCWRERVSSPARSGGWLFGVKLQVASNPKAMACQLCGGRTPEMYEEVTNDE